MEGLGFSMEAGEDAAMGSFTFRGEVFDLTQASWGGVRGEGDLEQACTQRWFGFEA